MLRLGVFVKKGVQDSDQNCHAVDLERVEIRSPSSEIRNKSESNRGV